MFPRGCLCCRSESSTYPYYLEAAEAKLLRAAGLPTRRVVYTVAMEGGFGTVQQMKGRPATSYEEVDPSAVVVCKIDKAGADANVAKFIKQGRRE